MLMKYLVVLVLMLSQNSIFASETLIQNEIINISGAGPINLNNLIGEKGLVVVTRDYNCPICKKYGPTIRKIESEYTTKGFNFLYLYVGTLKPYENSINDLNEYKLQGFSVVDVGLSLAKKFKIKTSTEVLVFTKNGVLKYKGPIDDQHSIMGSKPEPTQNYLKDVLVSLLDDKNIEFLSIGSPGCYVNYDDSKGLNLNSKTNLAANLFEKKCVFCHLQKQNLVDLSNIENIQSRKEMIKYTIQNNLMPPWNVTNNNVHWINDLSLSTTEKKLLLSWIDNDEYLKNKYEAKSEMEREWALGEPDLIFKIPEKVRIPEDGFVPYKHFLIKTNLDKDVWVKAYEVATNKKIVHHATFYILKDNTKTDNFDYNFSSRFGWTQGNAPEIFPLTVGTKLPAGAVIGLTVHYQPNGSIEYDDKTKIGFKLYKIQPLHERKEIVLIDDKFKIKANSKSTDVKMTQKIDHDIYLTAVNVHMHYRGRKSQINAKLPNGKSEILLKVDPFYFKHQFVYQLNKPMFFPKGTVFECINNFDNSKENTNNPDFKKDVVWGDQSIDEMSICSLYAY